MRARLFVVELVLTAAAPVAASSPGGLLHTQLRKRTQCLKAHGDGTWCVRGLTCRPPGGPSVVLLGYLWGFCSGWEALLVVGLGGGRKKTDSSHNSLFCILKSSFLESFFLLVESLNRFGEHLLTCKCVALEGTTHGQKKKKEVIGHTEKSLHG